ncbi:MAG TPA: WYL domain-containing protein [Holophagaceae bacterium]|nr:WYL domain-containing protein [Holophagaceae bacterium]
MPTKKTPKAAEADEMKPRKTAAKKAVKHDEPKPKAAKKAKTADAAAMPTPEAAPEVVEKAPKKAAKKAAKGASAEPVGLTPHAEAILAAIREGRAVELIFEDAEANAPRTFEPRQLTYDALAQAWYVFGWDRRYNAERHHRLDQLQEVNEVEGVGRGAQGPYAEGTPGNQIGGWLGGEPIPVKVLLQKQWVFAVKQAPPAFPGFKLEEKEEGKAQATFTATDLRAIARWAMQFGDGITVLEPARLLDRIRQAATAWGAKLPAPKAAPAPAPAPRAESRESRHHHDEPRRHEEPRREESRRREHAEDRDRAPKDAKVEVRIERL